MTITFLRFKARLIYGYQKIVITIILNTYKINIRLNYDQSVNMPLFQLLIH